MLSLERRVVLGSKGLIPLLNCCSCKAFPLNSCKVVHLDLESWGTLESAEGILHNSPSSFKFLPSWSCAQVAQHRSKGVSDRFKVP